MHPIRAEAGDELRRTGPRPRRDPVRVPPHRVDHRLVRQPGREFGVRMRGGDIVDPRLDEGEGAERHDDGDADRASDQDVQQLLSSHGGSTPDGENRYGCGRETQVNSLTQVPG